MAWEYRYVEKPPGGYVEKPASGTPASGIPASGTPASGREAVPFPIRSGTRSARVVGQVKTRLIDALLSGRPDLAVHPAEVEAWAEAEAQAVLQRNWLASIPPAESQRRASAVAQWRTFENAAAARRRELGLGPRSEAEVALLRSRALSEGALAPRTEELDALAEQGRAALQAAREAAPLVLEQARREAS